MSDVARDFAEAWSTTPSGNPRLVNTGDWVGFGGRTWAPVGNSVQTPFFAGNDQRDDMFGLLDQAMQEITNARANTADDVVELMLHGTQHVPGQTAATGLASPRVVPILNPTLEDELGGILEGQGHGRWSMGALPRPATLAPGQVLDDALDLALSEQELARFNSLYSPVTYDPWRSSGREPYFLGGGQGIRMRPGTRIDLATGSHPRIVPITLNHEFAHAFQNRVDYGNVRPGVADAYKTEIDPIHRYIGDRHPTPTAFDGVSDKVMEDAIAYEAELDKAMKKGTAAYGTRDYAYTNPGESHAVLHETRTGATGPRRFYGTDAKYTPVAERLVQQEKDMLRRFGDTGRTRGKPLAATGIAALGGLLAPVVAPMVVDKINEWTD